MGRLYTYRYAADLEYEGRIQSSYNSVVKLFLLLLIGWKKDTMQELRHSCFQS